MHAVLPGPPRLVPSPRLTAGAKPGTHRTGKPGRNVSVLKREHKQKWTGRSRRSAAGPGRMGRKAERQVRDRDEAAIRRGARSDGGMQRNTRRRTPFVFSMTEAS